MRLIRLERIGAIGQARPTMVAIAVEQRIGVAMNWRKILRFFGVFALAILVAAVLGSLAQTQLNLQRLIDLGMEIELPLRMRTSMADLLGFAPLWALIVAAAFSLAFPVAALLQRWLGWRQLWFPLAGAVAIWTALSLLHWALGNITVVAAARTGVGVALLSLAGAVGGLVQARLLRPRLPSA